VTQVFKSGPLGRVAALSQLDVLGQRLESLTTKEVLYDIYYTPDPEFKSLHYTELFTRAIMITPCDDRLRYGMAISAVSDTDAEPIDVEQRLLGMRLDKYRLTRQLDKTTIPSVVFLPGTNLLEHNVDWVRVFQLYRRGSKIKPHPITNGAWLKKLNDSFPGAVLPATLSGFDYLRRAETVYTTSASEMGLLGLLLGKVVKLVDSTDPTCARNIYRQIYKAVFSQTNPHIALRRFLASPYSGVCWVDDSSERMEKTLSLIALEHQRTYPKQL
jgi:hypothetical protein